MTIQTDPLILNTNSNAHLLLSPPWQTTVSGRYIIPLSSFLEIPLVDKHVELLHKCKGRFLKKTQSWTIPISSWKEIYLSLFTPHEEENKENLVENREVTSDEKQENQTISSSSSFTWEIPQPLFDCVEEFWKMVSSSD